MKQILVAFDGYFKSSGAVIYQGNDMNKIMRKIHQEHNYGIDEELKLSVEKMMEMLSENNGDGCDYIIVIYDIGRNEVLFHDSQIYDSEDYNIIINVDD